MTSWLISNTHLKLHVSQREPPNVAFKPNPDVVFLISAVGNCSLLGVSSEILGATWISVILLSITPNLPACLVSSTFWIVQNLSTSLHLAFYSCRRAYILPSLSATKTSQQFSLLPYLTVSSQQSNLGDLRIAVG